MAMYEQYAIADDAASIVSDATILADRYDAVMADTNFQESRSVNIYTDLHPASIPSIYDEDVATFVRSSLMQDQEKDCGEEDEEIVEGNDDNKKAKTPDYAVSTSGSSSSIPSQDPRERAPRIFDIQELGKTQRKLRWRTVLGRHEAFDVSCSPPLPQQGSLLRLCSSGWQPPPRPALTKQTVGVNFSSRADGEKQPVPIPTISWAAGHVDGHDDDSSISFNIHFSNLSDASAPSDMGCSNDEEYNASSTRSTITEETAMLLDQFIKFEGNCDYEEGEGLRLLDNIPLFALSFDLGVGGSLDSTISDGESIGESIGESHRTASSSAASETVSESPSERVAAESGGNDSPNDGLESRDSFTTTGNSETECSSQVSTFGTATIGSSTISQLDESEQSTNSKTDEDGEKSTLSEGESFSSNSSASASTTSEVISPTECFLGTLTCGAMGTREVNDVFHEEIIEDRYSPAATFDDFRTFAGEMERGVEVDINSFVRSNLLGNDFGEIHIYQSGSGDRNHHATENCVGAQSLCMSTYKFGRERSEEAG